MSVVTLSDEFEYEKILFETCHCSRIVSQTGVNVTVRAKVYQLLMLGPAMECRHTYGARRVQEHEPPGEPLGADSRGAHVGADADDTQLPCGQLVCAAPEVGKVSPVTGANSHLI